MILETPRLLLRDFTNNRRDMNDLVTNLNNEGIADNLSDVPYPYTPESAKKFLRECARESKEYPRRFYNVGMELKETGRIIGCLELAIDEHEQDKAAGVSFWQGPGYCGKGYMGEALQKWFKFAYDDLNLRRLEAVADINNVKSRKLLTQLGMREEGISLENYVSISNGQMHDIAYYALLKREYKEIEASLPGRFAPKPKITI